jgi:CHAT domain-containing protein
MLKKIYIIIFLLVNHTVFCQNSNVLENKIYNAVDLFIANPNEENFEKLSISEKEFSKKVKTKPELLAFVILNCNKAYYENLFGQTNQSIESYEKAWRIFEKNKLKDYDIVEYCLKPLGNLYTIIGDFDNAENIIKQYYFITESNSKYPNAENQKIASILNLSNVYQNSGRNYDAIDLLKKSINTESLTVLQKATLLNNLGSNYMLIDNFLEAKKALLNSVSILEKQKNQDQILSNSYRNLAAIALKEKDINKAKKYFLEAKKLFLKTSFQEPRKQAKLYYEEALLHFEEKNLVATKVSIAKIFQILVPNYSQSKKYIPNRDLLYSETVLLDALDLQALVFINQNQPKKALEVYDLSFHVEDLIQSLVVYENSKIINQVSARNRTEKCLAIYFSLYEKEKSKTYLEQAFLLAEKTKVNVLKNRMYRNNTTSQGEKIIIEQLQIFSNYIIKEQQKGNSADISAINEYISHQNRLMLELKNIGGYNTFHKIEDIELAKLYQKLKKDKATLVSYFVGSENIYSFTIDNNKIKLDQIITNEAKINTFLSYFANSDAILNNVSGYSKSGLALYQYLKLNILDKNKNLIIIPDGKLNFVPFDALITQKSSITNFSKLPYFLNDFNISYNNSTAFYLNYKNSKDNDNNVLGVFPVFENTTLELPFSKEELISIKEQFSGNFLEKDKATFANFKHNVSKYSILHLSTHASSGDIVEPATIKFYDQDILYSELYNLKINPSLVVLSACETGLGKLFKGEGAMSIARGFQYAGAQNILLSLWKVNDYTTSRLMSNFYQNIDNNDSYQESIHKAKLDFLEDKNIPIAKKSPYYWAPFVYYGNIENNNSNLWIWIIASVLLIIIGYFCYKKFNNPKRS